MISKEIDIGLQMVEHLVSILALTNPQWSIQLISFYCIDQPMVEYSVSILRLVLTNSCSIDCHSHANLPFQYSKISYLLLVLSSQRYV